ncbi:MAG: RecX family transcriptional regulator [Treponema sp.]|nr:RecX family transcriptional regulator [Treponema sp.]
MEKSENNTTTAYIHAEKIALRLVARAEQCSRGLALKLEKRKCDPASISEVISKLTELKLIDDSRFARLWLESRMRLTRSPRRLLSSLCAKGIEHEDAKAAISSVLDEEAEASLIVRFVKKHARKAGGRNNSEDGARSVKHLLKNEGFSTAAIKQFLGED